MGVSSLPKTVTRQRCGCDLNPAFCAWVQHAIHSATDPPDIVARRFVNVDPGSQSVEEWWRRRNATELSCPRRLTAFIRESVMTIKQSLTSVSSDLLRTAAGLNRRRQFHLLSTAKSLDSEVKRSKNGLGLGISGYRGVSLHIDTTAGFFLVESWFLDFVYWIVWETFYDDYDNSSVYK